MGVLALIRAWLAQRAGPRAAALALVVLGCCWARHVSAQFFSPGELSKSHAKLDGDEHCGDCHSAGNRVSVDKCVACHDDIGRALRQKTGLHGKKFAAQPCGSCHVDHRGRDQSLIRWDVKTFDHAQTGWKLQGAHARLDCSKCHSGMRPNDALPTYLGLNTTCNGCHQDKHEGRFGTSCQNCHSQANWNELRLDPFDHAQTRFVLRGKHKQVACNQCHGQPPKYQPLAFSACSDCHRDPHAGHLGPECESCHAEDSWKKLGMKSSSHPGLSLAEGHARVACKVCHDRGNLLAPSRGSRCVSCHAPVHLAKFGDDCAECHASIRWLGLPESLARRVHEKTRYPLLGKHEDTPCASCHSSRRPRAKRYRQLQFAACNDCHADAHAGEFKGRNGGECGQCHGLDGFVNTSFGVEQHSSTGFALSFGHEAAPCGSCHRPARPRLDLRLKGQACSDCHDNPHGAQFDVELRAGGCGACHNTIAWSLPNIAHESWPLTGAHRTAACGACHAPSEADRKAGSGPSYRNAPRNCEGCHEDVHAGQFRLSAPVRGCADCHDTKHFQLPSFDHARTGYLLEGKHAEVPCKGCHVENQLTSGERVTLWRLPYRACKDCHKDPHAEPSGSEAR